MGHDQLLGRARVAGRLEDDGGAGAEVAGDKGCRRARRRARCGTPSRSGVGTSMTATSKPARRAGSSVASYRPVARPASAWRRVCPRRRRSRRPAVWSCPCRRRTRRRRSPPRRPAGPAAARHSPGRRRPAWQGPAGPAHRMAATEGPTATPAPGRCGPSRSSSPGARTPVAPTENRRFRTRSPLTLGGRVPELVQAGEELVRRSGDGDQPMDVGVVGGQDLLVRGPELLVELLARPDPGDLDGDVDAHLVARQPDHPLGQVEDADRLAHLQHEDLAAAVGEHRRLQHQLDGLLHAHEEAGHAGSVTVTGPPVGDLAGEGRDHAAPAAEHVAEADGAVGGAVGWTGPARSARPAASRRP